MTTKSYECPKCHQGKFRSLRDMADHYIQCDHMLLIEPPPRPIGFQHAMSVFPKKLHQVVDHGHSVCIQVDDVTCSLSKLTDDGEFVKQRDTHLAPSIFTSGTEFGRLALRIEKSMIPQLIEALNQHVKDN